MASLTSIYNTVANWIYGLGKTTLVLNKNFKGIIAHRGVHGKGLATENSMDAFRLALENQIYGIEFDVRWTKDNVPVVYHDANLKRLHFKPEITIAEKSFADLRGLAPDIPSLEEVVSEFGGKLHFMIELKEKLDSESQRKNLLGLMSSLKPVDDFHFIALEPDNLDSLSGFPKEALLDIAWFDMKGMFQETLKRDHGGLTGHFVLLKDRYREELSQRGKSFGTGFIQTRGTLYREIERGCTWVFSDTPLRLKAFLN